jgi:hypothetical protein
MNDIVPFHGVAVATAGRLDVRAMVKHFTQPFKAAGPFSDLIEVLKHNYTPQIRRCRNRRRPAAIAINRAVAGRLDAVSEARDRLSVIMLAPDEQDVRALIGAMMMVFPSPPTETSSFLIDALVLELREPEADEPYSLPAIAAAAREMWRTVPSPPSIAEFLVAARKHQQRLDDVFRQLGDIIEAADWAEDTIKPKNPQTSDDDDPDFFPF